MTIILLPFGCTRLGRIQKFCVTKFSTGLYVVKHDIEVGAVPFCGCIDKSALSVKSPNRRNALESSNRTFSLVPSALNREALLISGIIFRYQQVLTTGSTWESDAFPQMSVVLKPPSVEIVQLRNAADRPDNAFFHQESSAPAPCESKYLRTPAAENQQVRGLAR